MKHPLNRQLYAYWNQRRGCRPAPERSDVDPGAIRHILGDSFILARDGDHGHPFRVAGTRICALFGRELRGEPFTSLWDAESAPQIRGLIDIIAEDCVGVVAGARAATADDLHCDLEMLLLPLVHRGRIGLRMLGVMAAMERPYWLGIWVAKPLRLGVIKFIGPDAGEIPAITAGPPVSGRVDRRHLKVIPGGRM